VLGIWGGTSSRAPGGLVGELGRYFKMASFVCGIDGGACGRLVAVKYRVGSDRYIEARRQIPLGGPSGERVTGAREAWVLWPLQDIDDLFVGWCAKHPRELLAMPRKLIEGAGERGRDTIPLVPGEPGLA
jgi:hypothetical protein